MPNILPMLKQDHREVAKILAVLKKTTSRGNKTRKNEFAKLKAALTLHTEFEETVLYPRLKEIKTTRALTFEAYEEHHLVKILLNEIAGIAETAETWKAKLTVLEEIVKHHVKEEEKELFPLAKKFLSTGELNSMGDEYQTMKDHRL